MGIMCSYETEYQSTVAKMIIDTVPCAEMVRFALSGSEAVKYMLRVARAYTGRRKILKFEGHFHGYEDYIVFNYAQPLLERKYIPSTPYLVPFCQSSGIPSEIKEFIIVVPFNDRTAVEKAFEENREDIAAVILEPIAFNMGCVLPDAGFLEFLRDITSENGSLLLFDEILSGFRTGPACAQGYYKVVPDLCTLGKAIAGGMPLSVFAGKAEIMAHVKPVGGAEHSGTFMGHLTGVMAAKASLEKLLRNEHFETTKRLGDQLYSGLTEIFKHSPIPACVQGIGDRFGIYFGMDQPPRNYEEVARYDARATQAFVKGMFDRGIYMLDAHGPKPVHHGFSAAHSEEDINMFLNAAEEVVRGLKHLILSVRKERR